MNLLFQVIVSAFENNCLHDTCSIIAMFVTGNALLNPTDQRKEALESRIMFKSKFGDHLMYRNIFKEYRKIEKKKKSWCKEHFINLRAMENANNVYEQLVGYAIENLGEQKEKESVEGLEDDEHDMEILKCFIRGFYRNVALLNQGANRKKGTYRMVGGSVENEITIHPSSSLVGKSPFAIVFGELVVTTKHYVRDVSAIEKRWLQTCVPNLYVNK